MHYDHIAGGKAFKDARAIIIGHVPLLVPSPLSIDCRKGAPSDWLVWVGGTALVRRRPSRAKVVDRARMQDDGCRFGIGRLVSIAARSCTASRRRRRATGTARSPP
jgi:hypothetical protein